MCHDHSGIVIHTLSLSHSHTHRHILHKHTKVKHTHTHMHTPSLGSVADSKPALKFLFYIFLCIILKNTGCAAKIVSLTSLSPRHSSSLPFFSLLSRLFSNVSFLIDSKQSIFLPITAKAHFIIQNSYKHPFYFLSSTSVRQNSPFFFQLLPF